MARLRSIFLIELVLFMVVISTTAQCVDGKWHSENRVTEWKNGEAKPRDGYWPSEVNRQQIEQKATEWRNGATQQNSGHLEWKNGRWYWNCGNSKSGSRVDDWKNGNSQPGYGNRPRNNQWQRDQQAAQWRNGAY